MSAADSQNHIVRQVRRLDHERYFATLFAPRDRRRALLALYAFNLDIATIRETVSEPLIGQMRLQWWRDAIAAIHDGRTPEHPVATALADAIARHDLARAPFDLMIDGRERDFEDESVPDIATLERYAEATSSSLVGLAFEVLGAEPAAACARHAGIAWCLAGLLRAAPFRAPGQRQPLPLEPSATSGRDDSGLVREIAASARRHIEAARRHQTGLSRQALSAILPVALVEPYLNRLARIEHDPFDGRLVRSRSARQWAMTMAALRRRI
jgi:phytoene synthase